MRKLLPVVLVFVLGCGAQYDESRMESTSNLKQIGLAMHNVQDSAESAAPAGATAAAEGGEAGAPPEAGKLQRKIVYTADVDLVVEEFTGVPEQVEELAAQFDGYVARSNVSGSPGSPRLGQWTVRVPVARFEAFLTAAGKLGEVRNVSKNSQDVSEEYYDVEARIRNRKRTEERLIGLLEDATGKLEDVLKVEKELNRVREEIERMEGRLRVLEDLTSMTTVEVRVSEIKNYEPEESATYLTRVRRAFESSIDNLVSAAQGFSIAVVFAAPWLVVLAVALFVLIWLLRLLLRPLFRLLFGPRRQIPTAEAAE